MIVIHVDYRVKPEHADAFRERVRRHSRNSLADPGCLRFDVAEADGEAGRFFIWEVYVDRAAVKRHMDLPSLAEFREAVEPMTEGRAIEMARLVAGDPEQG